MARVKLNVRAKELTQDGTVNVKLQIVHKSVHDKYVKRRDIATDVYVRPTQFQHGVIVNHARSESLNNNLDQAKRRIQDILQTLAGRTKFMTIEQIMDVVEDNLAPPKEESQEVKFFDVMEEYISSLKEKQINRAGIKKENRTAEIYQWTADTLSSYAGYRISFQDITTNFLESFFNHQLSNGNSVNTIAIHMRNIRRIFNKAYEWEYMDYGKYYPFKKYKIQTEETDFLDMNLNEIRKFVNYQAPDHYRQEAKDFFLISFLLIGINSIDIAYAEKDNVKKDRFIFHRSKSGRMYNIKIHPMLQDLMKKYEGDKYLFRFIETQPVIHNLTKTKNKWLKKIGEALEIGKITTYWARYTWANIAQDECGYSEERIEKALGHGPKKIVATYLRKNYKLIDEMNEAVIEKVFGEKKPET